MRKDLKNFFFIWDSENKVLEISSRTLEGFETRDSVRIPKSTMFSLARFVLRIAQKGSRRAVIRK